MAKQIKELDTKSDHLSSVPEDLHGKRRKLTSASCPLATVCVPWHMCNVQKNAFPTHHHNLHGELN